MFITSMWLGLGLGVGGWGLEVGGWGLGIGGRRSVLGLGVGDGVEGNSVCKIK